MTDTPVYRFADRAWSEFLELDPMWATVQGIETWDDRLDDPSAEGRAAMNALVERWAAELDELETGELSVEDTVVVTETGCRSLTEYPRHFQHLPV